jgi:bifunctional DNA-binding transcriptional regulator/antitoxin component of YhaV-PrlF toxin-antitoxin module
MQHGFKTPLFRQEGDVWDISIYVPKIQIDHLSLEKDKRVVCNINDVFDFQCALMPQGNGDFFININKEIRTKLKLEIGDNIEISLTKDDSKYGLPLPEELKTAWEVDEEGNHIFHSLTMGKQRTLIHIVGKVKSSEKRIEKALIILEYLKSVNGKLDFKELNEAFKLANNK